MQFATESTAFACSESFSLAPLNPHRLSEAANQVACLPWLMGRPRDLNLYRVTGVCVLSKTWMNKCN